MFAVCNGSGCVHSRTCPRSHPSNLPEQYAPNRAHPTPAQQLLRSERASGNSQERVPCIFFQKNSCSQGDRCRFSHTVSTSDVRSTMVPCKFFRQGLCRNGDSCPFFHDAPPPTSSAVPNACSDDHERVLDEASGWDDPPSVAATEIAASGSGEPSTEPAPLPSLQAAPLLEGSSPSTSLLSAGAAAFESCTFHMTGQCMRGDSCMVDHGEHVEIYPPMPSHISHLTGDLKRDNGDWIQFSETAIARAANYTPQSPFSVCFPQGMCNMGFMHGYEPNYSPNTSQAMIPCKYFALGTCRQANECPLVHDIRAQPVPGRKPHDAYGKGFCRFYSSGHCRKGSNCRFRHDSGDRPSSPTPNTVDPEASGEQPSGWLADTDDWGTDPQVASNWASSDYVSGWREESSWGEGVKSDRGVQDPSSEPPKDTPYEPAPVISAEPREETGTGWLADTDEWAGDPVDTKVLGSQEDTSQHRAVYDEPTLDWFQEVQESRTIQDLEESQRPSSIMPSPPVVTHPLERATDDELREEKSHSDDGGLQEDDGTKWGIPDPISKLQRVNSHIHGAGSQTKSGCLQEIDDNEWSTERQIEEESRAKQASENRIIDTNRVQGPSDNVRGTSERIACIFFQQNCCSQGDKCRFSHTVSTSDVRSTMIPCSYFRQGLCRNGDNCRFYHDTSIDIPLSFCAGASSGSHERFSEPPTQMKDLETEQSENTEAGWLQHTDESPEWNEWTTRQSADEWLTPVPSKMNGHHENNGWANTTRSSSPGKDLRAEQLWGQHTIRERDPVLLAEPERELPPQSIYHCTVRFGSGAIPEDVVTPFESRSLILSDYPLGIAHDDLVQLAEPYGVIKGTTFSVTPGGMRAHIEFEECSQAAEARVNLDGMTLTESVMHARLDSIGSVGGNIHERKTGRQLRLLWDAPSTSAWVFYPTVGVAKAESERLNGIMYGARKISAAYVKPRQTHSIPVLLRFLPLNVKNEELQKFCVRSSSVSLNPPNYQGSQNDNILQYLTDFGPVEFLEVLPTDPAHLEITGFVEFTTGEAAASALQALKETKHHEFLGKGGIISAQPVIYSKYDCSHCPFNLIREDLQRVSSPSSSSDATIRCYNQPPRVHIYGSEANAVAQLRKSVQNLLFGSELPIWDPYFDTPSSDEALKRINDDTSFHVRRDERRHVLRIWGSRAQAERKINRLLKVVQAKRHSLPLDDGSMPALIKGGLQSLQDAFGASKILLDVRSQLITVLGDMKTDVESRLKALAVGNSPGTGNCCLCFSDAVEPVELACSHTYCAECLKLLLRPVLGIEFTTPACVGRVQGGPCLEPVPIRAISLYLSTTDQATLFKSSLLSFVRSEPNYRFCPSGCSIIYRLGIKSTVYTCPECELDLCASCADPMHTGMTCAEYESLRESGFES
ncbi:hypothetical protein B0H12DRAFT_1325358 [Mycena haematopus]|nr:hypothetical protein B0H12DRAFT_1325358 [Mycena haematopus]